LWDNVSVSSALIVEISAQTHGLGRDWNPHAMRRVRARVDEEAATMGRRSLSHSAIAMGSVAGIDQATAREFAHAGAPVTTKQGAGAAAMDVSDARRPRTRGAGV